MLDRDTAKADLEKVARDIVSRKTWPVRDAAIFLGYSRTYMDMLVTRLEGQHDLVVVRPGGIKQLYAVDVLELFEIMHDVSFQELRNKWFNEHKMKAPGGRDSGGDRQKSLL